MALTDEQKKNMLIGGGVGALTLVIGWLLGSRKAEASPPSFAHQAPGHRPLPPVPQHRMSMQSDRKHKKPHRDDDHDRDRGERGDRGENGRGEYRKKHKRHHRGD